MQCEQGNHELYFRLYYKEDENTPELELWNCLLMGLWEDEYVKETEDLKRCWDLHEEGDYFQQTITRLDQELLPHTTLTAVFHEIIRNNRADFNLINNIYSTSTLNWLSLGYNIYPQATQFWTKQVENGFAERIEDELRFKAILGNIKKKKDVKKNK